MALLEVKNVGKIYGKKGTVSATEALCQVTFSVERGEFVAIMGDSGSGKTTLLNILGSLDQPTDGSVFLDGRDLSTLAKKQISKFRREELGFVFQDYSLLNNFNNKDNILLPLVLSHTPQKEMQERLMAVVAPLEIQDYLTKYPYEVSGGQAQRIAVARAIVTYPTLLLADEPTGALDSASSQSLMRIFQTLNQNYRQTILMVTHSVAAAANAHRVLFIKDGRIYNEIYRGEDNNVRFEDRIAKSLTLLNGGSLHD